MQDDYELPELGADPDVTEPEKLGVRRHGHFPRHRALVDYGLDARGRVVRRDSMGHLLRDFVVIAALAILISIVVKTFFLRPFYIPSASMHPTLIEDDRVLVNLLVPGAFPLERGDIIVFTDPGGWLPPISNPEKTPLQSFGDGALELVGLKPEDSANHLIKRVIGLPGDHVVCCSATGQLIVNDVPISEPYLQLNGNAAASGVEFDVTVPADSLWVMGDNRYNSEDSRYHQDAPTLGFVPMADVVGEAFLINWPLHRMQFLGNSPETFALVPKRDPAP